VREREGRVAANKTDEELQFNLQLLSEVLCVRNSQLYRYNQHLPFANFDERWNNFILVHENHQLLYSFLSIFRGTNVTAKFNFNLTPVQSYNIYYVFPKCVDW
jgi:hypothetical protein